MIRFVITVLMCCLLHLGASQDFVVLANGTKYEGKILDSRKKKVTIQLPDREEPVAIPKSQVKLLRYDHRSLFPKTISLELFLGGELISSASDIEKILVEQGFGETTELYFFGLSLGSVDYPVTSSRPFFGAAINYAIKPRSEVGLAFSSKRADVSGYRNNFGFARLRYTAFQAIPTYRRYSPYHKTYWEVGIPLTFFHLKEKQGRTTQEVPTAFRPGLKVGGGLVFSKKRVAGLQLRINYSIALPYFKMDSFLLESDFGSPSINLFEGHPIKNQSLELGIIYSFRFRSRKPSPP